MIADLIKVRQRVVLCHCCQNIFELAGQFNQFLKLAVPILAYVHVLMGFDRSFSGVLPAFEGFF
jgi:hypothetical protein